MEQRAVVLKSFLEDIARRAKQLRVQREQMTLRSYWLSNRVDEREVEHFYFVVETDSSVYTKRRAQVCDGPAGFLTLELGTCEFVEIAAPGARVCVACLERYETLKPRIYIDKTKKPHLRMRKKRAR